MANEKVRQLEISMAKVEGRLKSVEDTTDRIERKLDRFIESADNRYAPRWVAEAIKWFFGLIIAAFIAAVAYFIGWK